MPTRIFLPLLFACALLGACGQKGPLYLPQDPARPAPASRTPEPVQTSVSTRVEDTQTGRKPATEAQPAEQKPVEQSGNEPMESSEEPAVEK